LNKYFEIAKKLAMKPSSKKHYLFGAVGIRFDGKIVMSNNISNPGKDVHCHAEARLSRKLDKGSIVYVARVSKNGKHCRLARPCVECQRKLKSKKVSEVHYTINDYEWGTLNLL
jgi:tRNA(Arg) A34 adenosine deaminase TadA